MRLLLGLLVCAGVVWADEEDWEVAGDTTTNQEILEQDIEDFLDRKKYREQWVYDRAGIWDPLIWDISAGVWMTELRGPIKLGGNTLIDVTNVLGVQKSEEAPTVRVQASAGGWEAIADWYDVKYDGAQILQTEVELPDGTILPVGAAVVTDIDISVLRLLASARLWRQEEGLVNLHAVFGLNLYGLSGTITGITGPGSATAAWDVILPIPVIGLSVHGRLGPLFYRVEFAGIGISLSFPDELLDTVGGGSFDGSATVGYYFGDWLSVRAGYRYTSVEAFADSIKVEFKMDGFFVEVGFTF
ncbi:MAG: porin family protein [Planctomycetota bacterium]